MLSVILPCFNGADTIALQLEALARQRWEGAWEVVVVDNGSTDDSMAIVEGYRERLPDLRIVQAYQAPGPRRGVAHSYTVGFAAARGDIFLLCEADDEVGETWLAGMAEALARHDFVACAIDYGRLNRPEAIPSWQMQSREVGLTTIVQPLFLPCALGCSFGLRRRVYERIGNPVEACGASWDVDYCWRAHRAGFPLQFVPDVVVHYRLRNSFRSRFRQARAWGESQAVLLVRFGPPMSRARLVRHWASAARGFVRLGAGLLPALVRGRVATSWAWQFGWCVGYGKGWRHLWAACPETAGPAGSLRAMFRARHLVIRAPFYNLMAQRTDSTVPLCLI
jgi:glycosyltransferase involved in cell wall biosynthesis